MIAKFIISGPVTAVICFAILMIEGVTVGFALLISWLVGTGSVVALALYSGFFCKNETQADCKKPKDTAQSSSE